MNRLLFFFITVLYCAESRAQQVIWSQNFDYHYQSNFSNPWIITGSNGYFTWDCDVDYQIGGIAFPVTDNTTRVAGIKGAPVDSQVRLITPAFSLASATNAFFRYKSFFKRDSVAFKRESAVIEVTTDGGNTFTAVGNSSVATGTNYVPGTVNLSSFAGSPSVRVSFRYNDGGQSMTGWMIDELEAYIPAQNDLALIEAQPADSMLTYAIQNTSVPITGKVFNNGVQPVTAFTVNYKIGTGAVVSQTYAGLAIQPLDTVSFTCTQPAVIPGVGRFPVKIWISAPNDSNPANDSLQLKIFGASFIPQKVTAVEDATGTWYPFAPQQHVFMDALLGTDYPVNLISMHDADPMEDSAYVKYVEHLRTAYLPFFYYDRRTLVTPTRFVTIYDSLWIPHTYGVFDSGIFFDDFNQYRQHFGFADISLQPQIGNGSLTMKVGIKPAIDLQGDYRIVLAVTENKLQKNAAGYEQQNDYSGGSLGYMGGYESLPNPVPAAAMKYNYVARSASPSAGGTAGILPPSMTAGSTYSTTITTGLNSQWMQGNLHATILLINAADSTILNSASTPLPPLAINGPSDLAFGAVIYPNPATGSANLLYNLVGDEAVLITAEDVSGRIVQRLQPHTSGAAVQNTVILTAGWAPGLYLITLRTRSGTQTLKLTVLPE